MKTLWIDLESTGLSVWKDRIVQIGMIYQNKTSCLFINPECPIPEQATYIHKITNEMVKDAHHFSYYAPKLYNLFMECDAYGTYNGRKFDIPLLAFEMKRCGFDLPDKPITDVYEMIQDLEKSKKLKDVYLRFLGREMNNNAHRADYDIQCTYELYNQLLNKFFN